MAGLTSKSPSEAEVRCDSVLGPGLSPASSQGRANLSFARKWGGLLRCCQVCLEAAEAVWTTTSSSSTSRHKRFKLCKQRKHTLSAELRLLLLLFYLLLLGASHAMASEFRFCRDFALQSILFSFFRPQFIVDYKHLDCCTCRSCMHGIA